MSEQVSNRTLPRIFRMLRYARPYRAAWSMVLLLTFAAGAIALLLPWPMKVLVDHVLNGQPIDPTIARFFDLSRTGWIVAIAIAGLAFFVLSSLSDYLLTLTWMKVGQRMVYDLAEELMARVMRRSMPFHSKHGVGDLMSRVAADSYCVYTLVDVAVLAPFRALVTMALMVVLLWRMDWQLTLIALATAPVMASSSLLLGGPIRAAAKKRREVESKLMAHVQQTLSGIPVVQAFAQENREHTRFRAFADAAIGAQKRTLLASSLLNLAIGLVTTLGTALILYIGIRHVLAGALTLGSVLVFLAYLQQLQQQMRVFFGLNGALQNVGANVDRVCEILDEPCEIVESPDAIHVNDVRGELRFESVTFGYEPNRPVLSEVSLSVPPGNTVALVGSSGVGKSTLAGLVPRFFEPWNGRILLDNRDIRDLKVRSLRNNMAVVLQEAFLLPITVAQNIAYGRPDASRQQIEAAARAAGADEFIRKLPQGYDTQLAEHGSSLSGGEKQRIAIARAMLLDAPVLILDEPTASLDAETEAKIVDALHTLMRGRTTLVIAHRLSTVRNADGIVVLEGGSIVEQGTHDELIDLGGRYAAMYASQMDTAGRSDAALEVPT